MICKFLALNANASYAVSSSGDVLYIAPEHDALQTAISNPPVPIYTETYTLGTENNWLYIR